MKRVIRGLKGQINNFINQIVIVGANDIGIHLAQLLGKQNQNIFLIDEGEGFLPHLDDEVDVLAISGNPISLEVLKEVGFGVESTLIAVTDSDKLNLLLLFLGHHMGIKEGYALIRDQDYYHCFYPIISRLGTTYHLVNLWETVIHKIEHRSKLEIRTIYIDPEKNTNLLAIRFLSGHPQVGNKVQRIKFGNRSKVLYLIQNNKWYSNYHKMILNSGDIVLVRFDPREQESAMDKLIPFKNLHKLMVGGNGLIQALNHHWPNFSKKLVCIEKDYQLCQKMLQIMNNGLLLHGDGLDVSLLNEAGIGETDMFIAASKNDEVNLLSSLLARSYGVRDVLTILCKRQHTGMLERLKLDGIISIPQSMGDYFLSRIVPEISKTSVQFEVKVEKNNLSEGVHFIYRGGVIIPLKETTYQEGEEVITVNFRPKMA